MLIDELKKSDSWKLCKEFKPYLNNDDSNIYWEERGNILINLNSICVINNKTVKLYGGREVDCCKLEMTNGNEHFVLFED